MVVLVPFLLVSCVGDNNSLLSDKRASAYLEFQSRLYVVGGRGGFIKGWS